ncbi:MAG: MOSC domain-containing protein, partial [Pseudomonadota bacterium]
FDPANPKPLPKDRFVVLLKEAKLAGVEARLIGDKLALSYAGSSDAFDLATNAGRVAAAAFLKTALDLDEDPTLVRSDPHRFTDVSVVSEDLMYAVSILSLASVEDFAESVGSSIDPRRFRMNVEVEGWPAWRELDHVGGKVQLGEVRLEVLLRTKRCAATEVNPATAERDLPVPRLLRTERGHMDMGVYAKVIEPGIIRLGDNARLL